MKVSDTGTLYDKQVNTWKKQTLYKFLSFPYCKILTVFL